MALHPDATLEVARAAAVEHSERLGIKVPEVGFDLLHGSAAAYDVENKCVLVNIRHEWTTALHVTGAVAHELRHAWQDSHGLITTGPAALRHVMVAKEREYNPLPYYLLPEELDAFTYHFQVLDEIDPEFTRVPQDLRDFIRTFDEDATIEKRKAFHEAEMELAQSGRFHHFHGNRVWHELAVSRRERLGISTHTLTPTRGGDDHG